MTALATTCGPHVVLVAVFDRDPSGGYRNLVVSRQDREGQEPVPVDRRDLSDEEEAELAEALARACERMVGGEVSHG